MSRQVVESVIDRLLGDEELRLRLLEDPIEVLAELHARGFGLTSREIDAFIQADARIWFLEGDHTRAS